MQKDLKPNKFIAKLYDILQLPQNQLCICWNTQGTHIIIHDVQRFAQTVIPSNFRLTKFKSFVRQLHIYNFHKIAGDQNSVTFSNSLFVKGKIQNLSLIKRKRLTKRQRQQKEEQEARVLDQKLERQRDLNNQVNENFNQNNNLNPYYLFNSLQAFYNMPIKSQSQFFFDMPGKDAQNQQILTFKHQELFM